jgi:hypothetical protein
MTCVDGYIVPGIRGFSITVAKIHKASVSNSSEVNCRYCLTGVLHAQVILKSELMRRFEARIPLHHFGDGPTVPVGTAFVGASRKLTDNIVRVGVNYKFF